MLELEASRFDACPIGTLPKRTDAIGGWIDFNMEAVSKVKRARMTERGVYERFDAENVYHPWPHYALREASATKVERNWRWHLKATAK